MKTGDEVVVVAGKPHLLGKRGIVHFIHTRAGARKSSIWVRFNDKAPSLKFRPESLSPVTLLDLLAAIFDR